MAGWGGRRIDGKELKICESSRIKSMHEGQTSYLWG